MLRRLPPLLALVAALALTACGSQSASYTVQGDTPPASGPPITIAAFQAAVERHGVDLFQDRGAQDAGDLSPRPVDAQLFATADSGFFELYVFVDQKAAQAAVASAKNGSIASHGQIVQQGNVIAAIPDNGNTTMVKAVPGAMRELAQQAAQHPASPGTTTLQNNIPGQSDQPSGPPS